MRTHADSSSSDLVRPGTLQDRVLQHVRRNPGQLGSEVVEACDKRTRVGMLHSSNPVGSVLQELEAADLIEWTSKNDKLGWYIRG